MIKMVSYLGAQDYKHGNGKETLGILLANLGTPEAPTAAGLRPFLRKFLNDTRVIENSSLKWKFILNCIIIPFRSPRSAAAYRKVWQPKGSPLTIYSAGQHKKLSAALAQKLNIPVALELGMSYSNPSITDAMNRLQQKNISKLLVLPLYPQYSCSTVASVFDAVTTQLQRWRLVPQLRTINSYHDEPEFISAVANSITAYQSKHGKPQLLMFSFHGMPVSSLLKGDPYHCQCYKTARLVAEKLRLKSNEYMLCFQSRFGKSPWLQPYTDKTLESLPSQGVKNVQIVCPGFSSDCVETLEEIDQENREIFINAGGSEFGYIPCLNDTDEHIDALMAIIERNTKDWVEKLGMNNTAKNSKQTSQLAQNLKAKHPDYYADSS